MITEDISFLSPQDIESIGVFENPSSLAILELKQPMDCYYQNKNGKRETYFNRQFLFRMGKK